MQREHLTENVCVSFLCVLTVGSGMRRSTTGTRALSASRVRDGNSDVTDYAGTIAWWLYCRLHLENLASFFFFFFFFWFKWNRMFRYKLYC